MEKKLKKLLKNTHNKYTREIIEDHVNNIDLTNSDKVILTIDRKYALNMLNSHEYIWSVISWVKNTFWKEKKVVLKSQAHLLRNEKFEHHDKEMNIPYMIHHG